MRFGKKHHSKGFGSRESGFTLIELMVAVAIVGVLAAIAVPQYQNYVARAALTQTVTQLDQFAMDAEIYYQTEGELPTYSDVGFPSFFSTYGAVYGENSDVWNLILYYTTWDKSRGVVLYYSKSPHRFDDQFWQMAVLFRTTNGYFESICTSTFAAQRALPSTCRNTLLNWNW